MPDLLLQFAALTCAIYGEITPSYSLLLFCLAGSFGLFPGKGNEVKAASDEVSHVLGARGPVASKTLNRVDQALLNFCSDVALPLWSFPKASLANKTCSSQGFLILWSVSLLFLHMHPPPCFKRSLHVMDLLQL